MKRFELQRVSNSTIVTMGVLIDVSSGIPIMVTLELPDKGNQKFISCIPKGVYLCEPYTSPKYKDVYQIMDVLNRTKILIHVGNTVKDTEGCILVGSYFGEYKGNPAVLNSKGAFERLRSFTGNESFELIVS